MYILNTTNLPGYSITTMVWWRTRNEAFGHKRVDTCVSCIYGGMCLCVCVCVCVCVYIYIYLPFWISILFLASFSSKLLFVAFVMLLATLFLIQSPAASAVFWIALFEAVFIAYYPEFLGLSRVFDYTHCSCF